MISGIMVAKAAISLIITGELGYSRNVRKSVSVSETARGF